MNEEYTSVETQEVADPVTEVVESVETQETADPAPESVEVEETKEPTTTKSEQDSWYASKRRELEEERKRSEAELAEKLKAEQDKIAELQQFKEKYEAEQRETYLRKLAEENGVSYEEVLEEVSRQEEAEKVKADYEAEKENRTKLEKQIEELRNELVLKDLKTEDEAFFRTLDTKPEVNDAYYKYRVNGLSPQEAYYAVQAQKATVETAKPPGKVDSSQTENGLITEAEWDSYSKEMKDKFLNTDFDRVMRSQESWYKK